MGVHRFSLSLSLSEVTSHLSSETTQLVNMSGLCDKELAKFMFRIPQSGCAWFCFVLCWIIMVVGIGASIFFCICGEDEAEGESPKDGVGDAKDGDAKDKVPPV